MEREQIQKEVDANYAFFKEHRDEIATTNADKFVLMRNQAFIDFYSTKDDAITAGRSQYTDGLFSVQKVTEETIDLGSVGYALLQH